MNEIWHYLTASGKNVFSEWLDALDDEVAAARIASRINRLAVGNLGDCKPVGRGVWELRIDWGSGYRVYYAMAGKSVVLLLCGGDKRGQAADIRRAQLYWDDFKARNRK